MFKKLLWICFVLWSLVSFVFAKEVEFELKADKSQIDINDAFLLTLTIKQNQNVRISDVKTNWLENFEIVGSSNSTSMEIINEDIKTSTKVQYQLVPKSSWEHVIGPFEVEIGSQKLSTNTVTIKVTWDKIMMNNNANSFTNFNSWNSSSVQIIQWSLSRNSNENPINSLPNKIENWGLELIYVLWFVFIIIVMGVVLLWKMIYSKPKSTMNTLSNDVENKPIFKKYDLIVPDINDELFNQKVDIFVRNYIEQKYWIQTDNLTFDEIVFRLKKSGYYNLGILNVVLDKIKELKYGNTSSYKEVVSDMLTQLLKD